MAALSGRINVPNNTSTHTCIPVEDGPQSTPDAKRSATDNGKANMVSCTDATSQADEARRDEIADPDTNPRLPPAEAALYHRRRDHPSVDVEGIGNPETDIVPSSPLPALRLDGLEVMVGEQELPRGQARFGLDLKLLGQVVESLPYLAHVAEESRRCSSTRGNIEAEKQIPQHSRWEEVHAGTKRRKQRRAAPLYGVDAPPPDAAAKPSCDMQRPDEEKSVSVAATAASHRCDSGIAGPHAIAVSPCRASYQ